MSMAMMDDEGSLTYSATSGGSSNQDSIDSSLYKGGLTDEEQLERVLKEEGLSPLLLEEVNKDTVITRTVSRGSSNGDGAHGGAGSGSDTASSTPTNFSSRSGSPSYHMADTPLHFTAAEAPPKSSRSSRRHRRRQGRPLKKVGSSRASAAAVAATSSDHNNNTHHYTSSSPPAPKPPRPFPQAQPPAFAVAGSASPAETRQYPSMADSNQQQLSNEAWYAKPWMCGFADAFQLEGVLPDPPTSTPQLPPRSGSDTDKAFGL